MWQHTRGSASQGSSSKPWYLWCLLGVNHIGTELTLATPISSPQEVVLYQLSLLQAYKNHHHKSHYLHKLSIMAQSLRYTKAFFSGRIFHGLRGYHPGTCQGPVLKTCGICRVWAIQAWWVNPFLHRMPHLLYGSMACSSFQSPLLQTVLQKPRGLCKSHWTDATGVILSPVSKWPEASQPIIPLSSLSTSHWSLLLHVKSSQRRHSWDMKEQQITRGHTNASRTALSNTTAISYMLQLHTWNITTLNWDML